MNRKKELKKLFHNFMNDLRKCADQMIDDIGDALEDEKLEFDSTLPLHVRVAQALGWMDIVYKINPHYQDDPDNEEKMRWVGTPPGCGYDTRRALPRYDLNRDLALEALEEYCKSIKIGYALYYNTIEYKVNIAEKHGQWNKSRSLAICLTIVGPPENEEK